MGFDQKMQKVDQKALELVFWAKRTPFRVENTDMDWEGRVPSQICKVAPVA